MDKIKQNIDLQEAIQRYNIEKSVVGTLAYNIDQNLQKGMSPEEAIENVLQKSKSMPIGTIHNGFKKIADGKWRKVSEHGMTKEEHESKEKEEHSKFLKLSDKHGASWSANKTSSNSLEYNEAHRYRSEGNKHADIADKLDSKDYSDEEVTGGEKKEEMVNLLPTSDHHYKEAERLSKLQEKITSNKDWERAQKQIEGHLKEGERLEKLESTKKSQPESTLSKSEQKEKILKTMNDFKKGILKSQFGDIVTDPNVALEIALNEIQKGGEGSRGGKVIGHTKSGKPIYDVTGYKSSPKEGAHADEHVWTEKGREKHKEDHKDFTKEDHEDAIEIHKNKRHEYTRYVPNYGHHHSSTQLGAKETVKFHKHSDAILSHKSQLENL